MTAIFIILHSLFIFSCGAFMGKCIGEIIVSIEKLKEFRK